MIRFREFLARNYPFEMNYHCQKCTVALWNDLSFWKQTRPDTTSFFYDKRNDCHFESKQRASNLFLSKRVSSIISKWKPSIFRREYHQSSRSDSPSIISKRKPSLFRKDGQSIISKRQCVENWIDKEWELLIKWDVEVYLTTITDLKNDKWTYCYGLETSEPQCNCPIVWEKEGRW